jgi:hypothetical protein
MAANLETRAVLKSSTPQDSTKAITSALYRATHTTPNTNQQPTTHPAPTQPVDPTNPTNQLPEPTNLSTIMNESTLLYPWGGFRACELVTDCLDLNSTLPRIGVLCVKINGSPLPGLNCICDYGMGGHRCDQITMLTQSKLVVYLIAGGLALNCTLFCFAELWQRGKPAKVTPIIISLYFGVAACMLNAVWCALSTFYIMVPTNPSAPFLRDLISLAIVPASTSCPLASVLVISLAWQKVLIQSQMKKKKKKGLAGAMPDASKVQHNLVVGSISFLFIGGGILIALGQRTIISLIVCLLYGVSAGFLISKGKQFASVMGTSTAAASPTSSAKPSFRGNKVAPSEPSTNGTGVLSSMNTLSRPCARRKSPREH